MVFVFGSVYVGWVYRLAYVEPTLHAWNEAYLMVMDKVFDVLLQLVCQKFSEDFCIYVNHGHWPEVFFLCRISARFWYQDDVGLIK